MTYFDYFKVFLLKVGILNFVHISSNENNYCDIERNEYGFCYYLNCKLHRIGGPAIEHYNGYKSWYQNGLLHRIDGPAREWSNGSKFWFQNDKLHRIDGPACEYINGDKFWYQNDELSRLDGPAREFANGEKDWWIEGKYIDCNSQEEFERYLKLKLFW